MINNMDKKRADRYIVRLLSDEYSQADVDEIRSWQSAHPDHHSELEAAAECWADVEGLSSDPDIIALGQRRYFATPSGKFWPRIAVAASLLLAVLVGYLTILNPWNSQSDGALHSSIQRYVTRIGEQKTISLPDGSKLTLNTGSQVLVDYSNQYRRVIFDQGEVFFDVAKNIDKPFIVEIDDQSVTVLGTQFNIRKLPEQQLIVAVVEGLVGVHAKSEVVSQAAQDFSAMEGNLTVDRANQYRLSAGWVAQFDAREETITAFSTDQIERYASWRSGNIRFNKEPLSQIVKEINRYSGKKILIEDASVMAMKVNAVFNVNRLDVALTGLEASLPINIARYSDRYVITAKN